MTLMRWEPFRDLLSMQSRLNQALEGQSIWGTDESYGTWVPPVDIFERGDDLVIRAELPGVQRDDIEIRVENNVLVLHGERKRDDQMDEGKTYRAERTFGIFTRRFGLPTTVDAARITATYKDGVLEIELPKLEEAKPRKVEIHVA